MKRALSGESQAFECLVQRYQPVLYNVALRVTGSSEDAQDITQTAFLRAWDHLERFDRRRRFFSWLYRIALNLSLSSRARRTETIELSETIQSEAPSALEALAMRERRDDIERAIAGLPDHYREVVLLRHMADLSYQQIAEALDLPVKTVKSRLFTARRRLAERLAPAGGTA